MANILKALGRTRAGIDLGSALLADGSGLSAHNLIKASQMLEVLDFIARNNEQLQLIEKLPVAGMSGTLGSRGSVQMPPLVKKCILKAAPLATAMQVTDRRHCGAREPIAMAQPCTI